ncbi:hypothetical protein NFX52_28810, partial [Acidovorax facilis]|uniref:hypothetical protein n=1 Tax=Acidovorax facilis TaxID=12917 RepID=UPI00208F779F
SGGFARMLESVVLICGHCQGLLLHLRITFDPSQWWTLISVALSRESQEFLIDSPCVLMQRIV